jgi:hypothetical protein
MVEHLRPYEFQKGQPKTGGRKPGARNKLSHAFLEAFAEDFQKHGIEVIKIVRIERPHEYLKVAAYLMPKAFDDEHPAVLHIITGVPRHGEDYRVPQIPAATAAIPAPALEGDDVE